jgi:hypothetical protein
VCVSSDNRPEQPIPPIYLPKALTRSSWLYPITPVSIHHFNGLERKATETGWMGGLCSGCPDLGRPHWLRVVGPTFEICPRHVPLPCTGARDPMLGSGTESDPRVSTPTFRLVSESRGLNRASSRSKTASFPGQALHEPKLLHFGGPYCFNCLEWLEMNGWTLLRAPRSREAALVAGRGPDF